jgi:hypothetical protein
LEQNTLEKRFASDRNLYLNDAVRVSGTLECPFSTPAKLYRTILETSLGSIGKVLETATPEAGSSASIMASLGSVREKQTGELMEAFFRHQKRA